MPKSIINNEEVEAAGQARWTFGLSGLLLTLIFFVTGFAGVLLTVFVLACGAVFGRFGDQFVGPIQWLCGMVVAALYLAVFLAWNDDVIHWINPVSFSSDSKLMPYYSIPYQATPLPVDPLTRVRVLVGLTLPMLAIVVFLLRRRGKSTTSAVRRQNNTLLIVALIPAVFASVVKLRESSYLLATAMSGDSRNHFLLTQTIRLSGELVIGRGQWGVPKFANGIAAWLSAGNGAAGTLQRTDIEGMLGVYFLTLMGLSVVFAAGILLAANYSRIARRAQSAVSGLATVSVFAVFSSFIMGSILVDGFLSLSLGVLLLTISLVVGMKALEDPSFVLFGVLVASALLMLNAYTFLVIPCVAVLLIVVLRGVQRKSDVRHWWLSILVVGGIIGVFVVNYLVSDYWETFSQSVSLSGSVAELGPQIGWALLLLGFGGLIGSFAGISRAVTVPTLISMVAAFVTVQLIESVPGNEGSGLSYYAQKAFLGIVAANAWVLFVPLIPALIARVEREQGRSSRLRRRFQSPLEVLSMAVLPLLIVGLLSTLPNTVKEVWQGWLNPDASSVSMILDEWEKGDDYIFWRATDNPDRFAFPAPWADRVANLWSPATWDNMSARGMGPIWNWIYYEVKSDSQAELCPIVKNYPIRVITRDPLLEIQVLIACGSNKATFDVRPRR
jgi:hypothetical protein